MRVNLLGISFNIETNDDPDYIKKIVDIYSSKIENAKSFSSTQDSLKIAIIAGLLVSDQYLKKTKKSDLESQVKSKEKGNEKIILEMIKQIDSKLLEIKTDEEEYK